MLNDVIEEAKKSQQIENLVITKKSLENYKNENFNDEKSK